MLNEKRKLISTWLWVVTSILLIFSTRVPVSAFEIGYCVEVVVCGQPIHENITQDGLGFLKKNILETIVEADKRVDEGYLNTITTSHPFGDCPGLNCKSDPREHFDNCQFSASVDHINELYQDAINTDTLDLNTIAHNFGRLLHTAQDFYAHSNWIELDKTDLFSQGLDLWTPIKPFTLIDNDEVMVLEGEPTDAALMLRHDTNNIKRIIATKQGKEYLGLISGLAFDDVGCPKKIALPHWDGLITGLYPPNGIGDNGLNKDAPGRVGYDKARGLAVSQTTQEFCRLVNLVASNVNMDAAVSLFNSWVENREAAISECSKRRWSDELAQAVSHPTTNVGTDTSQTDCSNLKEGCYEFSYRFEDGERIVTLQGTAQPTDLMADYPVTGPYPVYTLETPEGALFYLAYLVIPASLNPVYPTGLLIFPEYEKGAYIPKFNSNLIGDVEIIDGFTNGEYGIILPDIPLPPPQEADNSNNSCGGSSALSETYDADGVCFNYPSGWVFAPSLSSGGLILMANSQATLDALKTSDDKATSGQQLIYVVTDVTRFGLLASINSPIDLVNLFSDGDGFSFNEATETTIGGKPAARKTGSGDKGDVQFIAINMGDPSDIRDYIMIWGATAQGEMGNLEETLDAVAESVMLKKTS